MVSMSVQGYFKMLVPPPPHQYFRGLSLPKSLYGLVICWEKIVWYSYILITKALLMLALWLLGYPVKRRWEILPSKNQDKHAGVYNYELRLVGFNTVQGCSSSGSYLSPLRSPANAENHMGTKEIWAETQMLFFRTLTFSWEVQDF